MVLTVRGFLASLLPWGTQVVLALQTWSQPGLDLLFIGLTFLGTQAFYFLMLPILTWCLDKKLGVRAALLVLGSVYLNEALKVVFQSPRPDPSVVRWVISADGWGFPSGHAQTTVALFGFLALNLRRYRRALFLWLIPPLVSLSRVYLGVHHPQDVVGGIVVGLVILAVFNWLLEVPRWRLWNRLGPWGQVGLLGLFTVGLSVPDVSRYATTAMGALLGMGCGATWEQRAVGFGPRTSAGRQIRKLATGFVLMILVYGLGKALLPEGPAFRFVRYAVLGGMATGVLPWFFARRGWGDTAGADGISSERNVVHA